ncbi:MAG: hypothetical protein A3F78_12025 [Burkholderiales bacterium RIFCSPLOWO2_12_FULL_61_40]|nr:MAG: hypothetical protein A3F78_12025 [Burkholderiales bacterium RIFCSPLOWO2_12_FULL_61_40]
MPEVAVPEGVKTKVVAAVVAADRTTSYCRSLPSTTLVSPARPPGSLAVTEATVGSSSVRVPVAVMVPTLSASVSEDSPTASSVVLTVTEKLETPMGTVMVPLPLLTTPSEKV